MDNNSWFFGASQNAAGGLFVVIVVAMAGAIAVLLARAAEWRWAAPLVYAIVTGGFLFGLLYGLLFQVKAPLYWWSFSILLLCMLGVLVYVDKKSQGLKTASVKDPAVGIDLLAGLKFPPLLPLPTGYDRLIPARSRQDEVEEGYVNASNIWAASIAGVYFAHLRDEDRKKVTQVLLVDPNSALMETLIRIQPLRGEDMPVSVKRAVKICKDEKIEVRLSSHPVLNVVLFDPGTPHAWARVQEFIPYHPGEESVVYAIRKEEWKDLYNTIEDSFKQAWKNGKDPNK
jgi:hypothetical protein